MDGGIDEVFGGVDLVVVFDGFGEVGEDVL